MQINKIKTREWVTVAALLPTVLLEGSALALVYGRHHWFRSEEQRNIPTLQEGPYGYCWPQRQLCISPSAVRNHFSSVG
jgi:hypothetical protein